VNLGILLREATGIKTGAAAEFENMSAGRRAVGGKESAGDLLGMIAEEVLATEGVEPGAALEETVGRTRGGMREGSPGHFAVAWFHS
jgi:hypothetical protein